MTAYRAFHCAALMIALLVSGAAAATPSHSRTSRHSLPLLASAVRAFQASSRSLHTHRQAYSVLDVR